MAISSVDLSKYMAMYGTNGVNSANMPVSSPAQGAVTTEHVDKNAITGLATKNVQARLGIQSNDPVTQAAAAQVAAPIQAQPQLQKVDFSTVNDKFGAQPVYNKANSYRNFAASDAYIKTKNSDNQTGYGQYDGLKNFKSNNNKQVAQAGSTNPFANMSKTNGSAYTQGLNFAGVNNIDPEKNMFIA